MNASDLLFVYGSLRRDSGHAMSRWLAERADWLGSARVDGVLCRISWYPGLVCGDGIVHGDLYRLHYPAAAWPGLDAFEDIHGNANDEYQRRLTPVTSTDGKIHHAWVYWYCREACQENRIDSGDWLSP